LKKLLFFAVVLALSSFDGRHVELTEQERKFALDELVRTKENLLASIKGLSIEQLNFKSSPATWSVAQCVEHIAISESKIWTALEEAVKQPANPTKHNEVKFSDTDLIKMIADRTQKIKTLEPYEPKGRNFEECINEFSSNREKNLAYIRSTKDDLRNHYSKMPFGTLDGFQVVIFMSGHTARHTAQIESIKAESNFPKK
jgi:hypothetical protein